MAFSTLDNSSGAPPTTHLSTRGVLESGYPHCRDNNLLPFTGSFVVAITTDDKLLLVQSNRPNREVELPGGIIQMQDDWEHTIPETPLQAAVRETREEAGITDIRNVADFFGAMAFISSVRRVRTASFIFTGLDPNILDMNYKGDDGESDGLMTIPIKEFLRLPDNRQEPDSPRKTFNGNKVIVTAALGALSHGLPPTGFIDNLSPPFISGYLRENYLA